MELLYSKKPRSMGFLTPSVEFYASAMSQYGSPEQKKRLGFSSIILSNWDNYLWRYDGRRLRASDYIRYVKFLDENGYFYGRGSTVNKFDELVDNAMDFVSRIAEPITKINDSQLNTVMARLKNSSPANEDSALRDLKNAFAKFDFDRSFRGNYSNPLYSSVNFFSGSLRQGGRFFNGPLIVRDANRPRLQELLLIVGYLLSNGVSFYNFDNFLCDSINLEVMTDHELMTIKHSGLTSEPESFGPYVVAELADSFTELSGAVFAQFIASLNTIMSMGVPVILNGIPLSEIFESCGIVHIKGGAFIARASTDIKWLEEACEAAGVQSKVSLFLRIAEKCCHSFMTSVISPIVTMDRKPEVSCQDILEQARRDVERLSVFARNDLPIEGSKLQTELGLFGTELPSKDDFLKKAGGLLGR